MSSPVRLLSPAQAWNLTPHLSLNTRPLSHLTNREKVFTNLTNRSQTVTLYRKGPPAIKYDKSAHSLPYEIMLAAACFCDSLNQECLVTRWGRCGGFHHFWPELISTICHPQEKFLIFLILCSMKNVWDVWVMMVDSLLIPQWSRDHFSPHWLWLWGIIIMHHIIVAVSEWVHPSLWRSGAYWECLIKMDQDNTGYCYKRIITRHLGICGGKCYLNLLKLYFVLQSLFFHDYTILLYFYIVNVFVTNNEVNLLYSKTIWTFCQFNVG